MTAEFSIQLLKEAERTIVKKFVWGDMVSSLYAFRSALISIALERPPTLDVEASHALHVLVVSRSDASSHESLLLNVRPNSRVWVRSR